MGEDRSMMHAVILFSVFVGIAWGRPTQEAEPHSSEYVHVQLLSGNMNRNKRTAEQKLPTNAAVAFKMTGGNVVLDLVRSDHSGHQLPVYTLSEHGIHLRNIHTKDNYATYQDVSRGASVLIKYPHESTDRFELFGEFIHNGSHFMIEPSKSTRRNKRDDVISDNGGERHLVTRQRGEYFIFDGDAIYPPIQENAGALGPKRRNGALVRPVEVENVPNVLSLKMTRSKEARGAPVDNTSSPDHESRDRRETEPLYVEYLVVADYRNTQKWKEQVPGITETDKLDNALKAMAEYYVLVVNGIDLRYRSATGDGPEIRVVFANLLVSTTEITSPWTSGNKLSENTVDDQGTLLAFANWRSSVYKYLPQHDHAALYTGFDLVAASSSSPVGIGYLNSICHSTWAVSEIEETFNAMTVHIAAHELGHNLGTRHDGSGNSCSSNAMYLMAPRLPFIYNHETRSNPWTFSSCSQSSIKLYLSGLSDKCLTNKPESVEKRGSVGSGSDDEFAAGLRYTPDHQCNMTYGNEAVLCRENLHNKWDTICYAMQCREVDSTSCGDRFFAFDGTPCGDKMWCKAGNCEFSTDAPSRHPSCVFGDDPAVSCTTGLSCDDSDYTHREILCCDTCLSINQSSTSSTTTPGSSSTETSTKTSSSATPVITQTDGFSSSISSTTESPETNSPTGTSLSTLSTRPHSTQTKHSTDFTQTIHSTNTTQTAQSTASAQTIQSTETTQTTQSTVTTQTIQSTETTQTIKSTTTTQTTDNNKHTSPYTTTQDPNRHSTTYSTMASTSDSFVQTTTSENIPTDELSFKLQTLVSLFMAAAIVI